MLGVLRQENETLRMFMSHGPHSYLKIKKGLQGKELGHGFWYNGFVKPATKLDKRKANRKVRQASKRIEEDNDEDVPNGNFYKKLWGYWEWC